MRLTFYKVNDCGVVNIPKCGSQSLGAISEALLDDTQQHLVKNMMAFIREPMDRLKSLYRFQLETHHLAGFPIRCWNCFVEWVLETDDYHAKPQTEFLFGGETLYTLDNMDEVLQGITGKAVPKLNTTSIDIPYTDYKANELVEKYQSDYDLYRSLS